MSEQTEATEATVWFEAGRVVRLARLVLDAYQTYDAARDRVAQLRTDAGRTLREPSAQSVVEMWDAVTVQLNEWEHDATAARREGAY